MPPKGRGRGAGGSGGSGSGSAASSGAAAPPPSAPAAASLLSAELRSAFRELPGYADAVVPAPIQRGAQPAAAPAGSRLSPSQEHRLERFLARLLIDIEGLPVMRPDIAAALAELLSQEPAAAAALLKLQAAALRPCGGGGAEALTAEHWRLLHKAIYTMLVKVMPLPPSRHALSVLRFVRAMLRAQPFHALSRQLTAMTTALEAGRHGGGDGSSSGGRGGGSSSGGGGAGSSSGGGRGRNGGVRSHPAGLETGAGGGHDAGGFRLAPKTADAADKVLMLGVFLLNAMSAVLGLGPNLPPALQPETGNEAAEAAAAGTERAACVEELARALAESGFLEHAARLTLILQTHLPTELQRRRSGQRLKPMRILWQALERARGPARLIWAPTNHTDTAASGISPAAAAHLRSALSGRCVQTAVLVYGVGTLRVADRGPSYGLPTQLQSAGLALLREGERGARCLDPVALELLLRQLASGSALPPPGPGASLELALRVGRAAAGAPRDAAEGGRTRSPALLAVGALACGRLLLPRQRPSPRLKAQRVEWWRLARWAAALKDGLKEGPLRQMWELVTEPLLAVWPNGRLDLDALPPAAPPEVAAALAGGLLPQLMTHIGAAAYLQKDYVYLRTLFAACDEARPDGSGLALFLTPLLAYGDPGEGEELVEVLTALIQLRPEASGGGPSSSGTHCESYWRAAAALLHATAGALGRCRYVGPTTEAPAGLAEAAEGGGEDPAMRTGAGTAAAVDPPPDPQQQLRRLLAPFLAAGQAL